MAERPGVGFAGLGRMGRPMAANVARAGFPLWLWNRTAKKAEALAAELGGGTSVADSPAALARECSIVITMVADDAASEALYLGPGGLLSEARGRLYVEMSTVSTGHIGVLAAAASERGAALLDAPVSGSVQAASAGELLIMAGGAEADLERARPALEPMAKRVLHTGPSGTGAYMKIVVNALIHGLNQTLAEALAVAGAGGIAREDAYAVIENSAACAPMLRYRKPLYLDEANHPVTFALALARKDMGLMLELARRGGCAVPQSEVTFDCLRRAVAAGYGHRDMAAMATFMRGPDYAEDPS